jgi:hypothetical protein
MHEFFQRLFKPIVSREEALLVVRDAARACYVVAGLSLLAATVLGWGILLDAVVYAALGGWLQHSRSRVAAALLLAVSGASLVMTVLAYLKIVAGGRNLLLAAIVALVALRAWDATTRLASSSQKSGDLIAS